SLPIVVHAAADLPPGNCAAPQAATDLSQCDFSRNKLVGRDLRGVRLAGAKLESTDFTRANLSGADLRGSNAKWANFTAANLAGADL
ncbi:MAG TPA: pentapeptide repeat-containing protein, partial [Rhodocyclaceae bacterium]|nr:pentapeptide repeat-containing protein [Rhodocyclaceae bacterium]